LREFCSAIIYRLLQIGEGMQIRIGLENEFEGRSLVWVLDFPGCFAYGKDGSEAILRVPQALLFFQEWLSEKTEYSWLKNLGDFDIQLTEIFKCYSIPKASGSGAERNEINAWFEDDAKALTNQDIFQGLSVLSWSLQDLETLVVPLNQEQREQIFPNERWNINGVVKHIANAEWWYLNRLGLVDSPCSYLNDQPLERLAQIQTLFSQKLPEHANDPTCNKIDGELWSVRKILRRAAWHIRDHHFHIERLMTLLRD
jgi:hypothetical protein